MITECGNNTKRDTQTDSKQNESGPSHALETQNFSRRTRLSLHTFRNHEAHLKAQRIDELNTSKVCFIVSNNRAFIIFGN